VVREFEKVLTKQILDRAVGSEGAAELYGKLPVSDQAQIREFYLTRVEQVSVDLREKYKKIYRYA